jgi:hypothetical protein
MNTGKTNAKAIEAAEPDATMSAAEQPHFVKRIGQTTYKVTIHFNPNSKETMSDKIIRMLRNEVANM